MYLLPTLLNGLQDVMNVGLAGQMHVPDLVNGWVNR
jgi:hypothetical protein